MRHPSAPTRSTAERAARARAALRWGSLLLLAGVMAACSSDKAPTTYDLTAPTGRVRGGVPGQLLVAEPAAVQALSDQRILVKDAAGAISFLGDGQWADQLPKLVQARLLHTFENTSSIKAVARASSGVSGDVQLISELRSFHIAGATGEAVVEISAKLVSDSEGRVVAGRIFRGRVPVGAIDAPNAARALDQALSGVLLEIVRWVGGGGSRVS